MSPDSATPWSAWLDLSKNAWDTWSQTVAQTAEAFTPTGKSADTPLTSLYGQTNPFLAWNPFVASNPGAPNPAAYAQGLYKQWEDGMRNFVSLIPNSSLKDSYERFFGSYQFFNNLQKFWEDNLQKVPTSPKDWQEYFKPLTEQYQNVVQPLLQPWSPAFLTDSVKSVFDGTLEGVTNIQHLISDLWKPVVDASPELQGLLVKAAQGDREAYLEYLNKAGGAYREVTSKMLNMPAMGGNRKVLEKTQKLVDQYIEYVTRASEYSSLQQNQLSSTMEKLVAHLTELATKGEAPKTFKEFYQLWSDFNEKAFLELFASDIFEKTMNDTVAAGSRFKILYDDFLQDVFEPLPFPNRREMDSVEEEVYKLRNKLKVLEKEIKALKTDQPAKPAAAPKTTKKA
ncbi:MAG: hypothetical protein LBN10_05850 [Propionibacteriaceae bacterium]|jgi:class III poly(R)-hydroxyalkanoic acid synthase PhaE subunit|nr:hypothetical protein [Propionibacteriaceae bacterium]